MKKVASIAIGFILFTINSYAASSKKSSSSQYNTFSTQAIYFAGITGGELLSPLPTPVVFSFFSEVLPTENTSLRALYDIC